MCRDANRISQYVDHAPGPVESESLVKKPKNSHFYVVMLTSKNNHQISKGQKRHNVP
ncbi:hypothetical protein STEG23_020091, partial [Scotinomys teguina]